MKKMFTKLRDLTAPVAVGIVLCWMCFALSFQLYFCIGMALDQEEKLRVVTDELTVRIDGNYVNDPRSWWYVGTEK